MQYTALKCRFLNSIVKQCPNVINFSICPIVARNILWTNSIAHRFHLLPAVGSEIETETLDTHTNSMMTAVCQLPHRIDKFPDSTTVKYILEHIVCEPLASYSHTVYFDHMPIQIHETTAPKRRCDNKNTEKIVCFGLFVRIFHSKNR